MHITYKYFTIIKNYAYNRYSIMYDFNIKKLLIASLKMSRLITMLFYAI